MIFVCKLELRNGEMFADVPYVIRLISSFQNFNMNFNNRLYRNFSSSISDTEKRTQ